MTLIDWLAGLLIRARVYSRAQATIVGMNRLGEQDRACTELKDSSFSNISASSIELLASKSWNIYGLNLSKTGVELGPASLEIHFFEF